VKNLLAYHQVHHQQVGNLAVYHQAHLHQAGNLAVYHPVHLQQVVYQKVLLLAVPVHQSIHLIVLAVKKVEA